MARKDEISLKRQRDRGHISYFSAIEAREMVENKDAQWICRHCQSNAESQACLARGMKHEFDLVSTQGNSTPSKRTDPASLSFSVMLANVGLARKHTVTKKVHARAQEKVENWPLPSPRVKTVTIAPRTAFSLAEKLVKMGLQPCTT